MNTNNVISLPASVDTLEPHRRVKMTSTGVAYAGVGDKSIGTLLPSDLDPNTAAVLLHGTAHPYATLGSATDVVAGDELEAAANGKVVKKTTGKTVAIACEAAGADGEVLRVIDVHPGNAVTHEVIAAGIHVWAGGAATADSIAVAGLVATDVVTATLVARGAAETLVMAANDAGNDQIDLTLSANGTDGTTKVAYQVLRAVA